MTIEPFGNIEYNKRDKKWFGHVNNISPNNKVELSISVDNPDQDLSVKMEQVKKLADDYETIVANIYDLVYNKYKDTEFEVARGEIEKMYFLTALNLKEDNLTWWLVLEPDFNVTSVYNQFFRFTMRDRKIIWTNFDINTTD